MGHVWHEKPEYKITVGDAEVELQKHGLTLDVFRIENGIARLNLTASNAEGRNYLRKVKLWRTLNCYLRQHADQEWTHVFGGMAEKCQPMISSSGTVLGLTAYGHGRAFSKTHCAVDYGTESENSGFDTPSEIISDLITNRVNKNFDLASTGWGILQGYTLTMNNPSIAFVLGGYRPNIDVLSEVALMFQAYQDGAAGFHWFVDPDRYFRCDQIANHTKLAFNWPTYWKRSQAASRLLQKKDILSCNIGKDVNEYANKIILATGFRKPQYDNWTENTSGIWGSEALGGGVNVRIVDDSTDFIVRSYSIKFGGQNGGSSLFYYPSTEDAGWNFENVESPHNPPRLNFYFMEDDLIDASQCFVRLFTTDRSNDYFECAFNNWTEPHSNWYHRSLAIGNYWRNIAESMPYRWTKYGNADWADINGIAFKFQNDASATWTDLWVDDLHFSGKLIREAYNSTEIARVNREYQKIVKMETAVNDTLNPTDDSGAAGRIAYAELIRRMQEPQRGTLSVPVAPGILPGQLVAVQHDMKPNGSYGIDDDFRCQQIHHHIDARSASTSLTVTDDMICTFAVGVSEALAILAKALYTDPEAKSLKTDGIDHLIQRLSNDYA